MIFEFNFYFIHINIYFIIMSYKTSFISNSKSLTNKKLITIKNSDPKIIFLQQNNDNFIKYQHSFYFYSLSYKNLKKYSTTIRKYRIFIINSIIFDQRIHKVAVFKNNLLWDESSEFLKRFYLKKESIERIPKISEYYEKYTLFPPVYFGLEGLIIIIMNKWTKRKKNYLEYIEDHEDEKEEKKKAKKNISFECLINPSLITNKNSSKSIISKNTLDLSKVGYDSNKKSIDFKYLGSNKNNFNKEKSKKNKDNYKENIKTLSFSEIIDDLSSHYSIIINNDKENEIERDKKLKKNLNNHLNKKDGKKEGRNETNVKKQRNTYNCITNNNSKIYMNNTSKHKIIDSPRKTIKICLNKKNNKYILTNNNNNMIKRNNNFQFPLEIKKYEKRIINTDNNLYKTQNLPINGTFNKKIKNKDKIKVNTIINYLSEKDKIINRNLLQKKGDSNSNKKINLNYNKNYNIKKNSQYKNKKKISCSTINNINFLHSIEKNLVNKNYNQSKINKNKYIQIKRKSFIKTNNFNNSINNNKPLTFRNNTNQELLYYRERSNIQHLNGGITLNNENKENINSKDIRLTQKNNKKLLYFQDPFVYKLTQLTKKKQTSLTSTNSLSKIKNSNNFIHYGISSIIENNNTEANYNISNLNKVNYGKNLVLTKLNSKKNLAYDFKSKLLGEDILRNNSISLYKNHDNSISFKIPEKISNSHSFKTNKKNNTKNINLNLNLNIHFNIDMENKNKGKKILLNNAIINQLQNKSNNNNEKYSNLNQNKDPIYQFPLTSRNCKRYLKDLNDFNKIEYTILKKY